MPQQQGVGAASQELPLAASNLKHQLRDTLMASSVHESRSREPLCLAAEDSDRSNEDTSVSSSVETYPVGDVRGDGGDDAGGSCGWGPFRPRILQRCRSPRWALFWLCWAGALQGLVVNGFVNVVITTIEKRYELRSAESGLIAGGYDIASFLCLIPVSYFGGARSKPLFVGSGLLILALGSLVFSMPHFLSGQYAFSQEREAVCHLQQHRNSTCTLQESTSLSNYKYLFLAGQLLHGAGAAPLYTLGCTYIDENVSTKMSSVYIGIFYTMAIIGPAVGYMLGGQFLQLYTDISVNITELGLTPASSVWVGAWWIGFLFAACLGVLISLPILAFPKVLPGYAKVQAQKVSEMHQKLEDSEAVQVGFGTRLKDLPTSLKILVMNPTFMFLSLAGASEGMLVSGLATFMPKVIESQFNIAASYAALLVGMVTVPGAGGGTFLGGYLVKKFSLRCAGIIRMCIIFSVICLCFSFIFVIHCPNVLFAGLNTDNSSSIPTNQAFTAVCNAACGCDHAQYDPVCGADGTMYFSPCFAGCKKMYHHEGTKVYEDCECIGAKGDNTTISGSVVWVQARREKCDNHCSHLPFFLVFIFLCMLFTFLVSMPSLAATLRCVANSQKSFALGIQWIAVRILGTIPAPMIFGALIDLSCEMWDDTCGKRGACRYYENSRMSTNTVALAVLLKALSCLFFFLAWFLYRPPKAEESVEEPSEPSLRRVSMPSIPVQRPSIVRLQQKRASMPSLQVDQVSALSLQEKLAAKKMNSVNGIRL